jgi:hypothetical protein
MKITHVTTRVLSTPADNPAAIDLACWDLRGKALGRIRSRTTTTPGSRLWPTR